MIRADYKFTTFRRSVKAGEAVDLGGFGLIEFQAPTRIVLTVPAHAVRFLPADDAEPDTLKISAAIMETGRTPAA